MLLITVVLAIVAAAMDFGAAYWFAVLAPKFVQVLVDAGAPIPALGVLLFPARHFIAVGLSLIGVVVLAKEFLTKNMALKLVISSIGFIVAMFMYFVVHTCYYGPAVRIKFSEKGKARAVPQQVIPAAEAAPAAQP